MIERLGGAQGHAAFYSWLCGGGIADAAVVYTRSDRRGLMAVLLLERRGTDGRAVVLVLWPKLGQLFRKRSGGDRSAIPT